MTPTNDHAVDVLNSLIETTLDSANGYREAAENAEAAEFKTMFSQRSTRRLDLAQQLQQEVRSFGAQPKDEQSLIGKAHNKFVDLKNAVTGGADDKSVIDEVERGEDVIKAKYEKVLNDRELPENVRQLVNQAYGSIKADHDEISRLKHQMH
jgi:uncharacterized protein (TIGR02284 family)